MNKPIPGFPGYTASEDGQIVSEQRVITKRNEVTMTVRRRVLKQSVSGGYYVVGITGQCGSIVKRVHVLVALAYLQRPDEAHAEIDHVNRNKLDNRVSNLRWVTASVNRMNSDKVLSKASGVRGVSHDSATSSWRVSFRKRSLGRYKNRLEAIRARRELESEYWKEAE